MEKSKRKKALGTEFLSKMPPQAVELEEVVLGGCLLDKSGFVSVSDFLNDDDFYKESHQLIFKAFKALSKKREPIDIMTVTVQLRASEELELVGGAHYISQLTNRVSSTANIEYHARIIVEKSLQRKLIAICNGVVNTCFEPTCEIFATLDDLQKQILAATSVVQTNKTDAKSRIEYTRSVIYESMTREDGLTGIPSGFTSLDGFTGGWQKGDLIVIGALPGAGKTALTLAMLHNAANFKFKAFMAQQEMSEFQTGIREIAMHTGINMEDQRRGKLNETDIHHMESMISTISKKQVYVDHTSGITFTKLRSKLIRQKMEFGLDIAAIDYLQLMNLEREKGQSEESAISYMTRSLKSLAKELEIPLILLSQLTKEVLKSDNKRPHNGNLKGSGAIEADADIIALLYNPCLYDKNATDEQGNSMQGKIEINFTKNRNGRLGPKHLYWNPATNLFSDPDITPRPIGSLYKDATESVRSAMSPNLNADKAPF